MKIRVALSIFISICSMTLVSCNKSTSTTKSIEVVKEKKETTFDEKSEEENQQTDKESKEESKKEPRETTESVGDYNIKMKSGTKTLKGSVDVSHENKSLLHINIKPDAEVSLFRPELFGPENLMVVQVVEPGSGFEYFIIPLDSDRAKVDKTFKTFDNPPEILEAPKNGEFSLGFLEPFPDSGARRIAPFVALKYRKGKLSLDSKEMKERARGEQLGDIQSIKDAFDVHENSCDVPAELTDEIVSRFYLGRGKEARQFFDKAWPKKYKGKAIAWRRIMDQLHESPYWPQIKAMNKM
ncbi:MAG: hypothetical protein SFY67_09985 [Candidatus Melainabacteria bacterium]|nr:hypothetical protein [Candidatus Melainabacteria bacterium]